MLGELQKPTNPNRELRYFLALAREASISRGDRGRLPMSRLGAILPQASMLTITNKTIKPLSVPLPRGKKLRLGPLKSGEISPKAVDHPPVQKLIEAGKVEIFGSGQKSRRAGGSGSASRPSSGGFNRLRQTNRSGTTGRGGTELALRTRDILSCVLGASESLSRCSSVQRLLR